MTVLYQHLTIAIDHGASGCTQRQTPLVIVLRHGEEPLVLANLHMPESDEQRGKDQYSSVLKQP